MKRIALALWLIAPPTQAQEVEQVTVYGGSLSGFWHVTSPGSIGISLFGKTVEDALAAARAMHLGNIENISLLGRQRKPETDDARTPVDLAVYAVEFAEGERICWLHQDDDGRLDTFQCG